MMTFSIMKLFADHIDEICEDIQMQYDNNIADMVLFSMSLVPEGNPPKDKVEVLCKKYDMFRERLAERGIPSGVLVQSSIGHGWVLSEKFPYQSYVNLIDGKEDYVVCPYDEGFREYIYSVMKTIAEHEPDHIMVDDDFRLMFRAGGGCACPLHMQKFNEIAGTQLTREELVNIISLDDKNSREYLDVFVQTQRESLVECAKVMRAGIDAVNPKLPGSFCCVGTGAENGAEIASVLAGEGNPVIVRINNARYAAEGAKFLSNSFFKAKSQIEKLKNDVDIILAETDTCPQNRYSTSANMLHTHFSGSILEGAAGAKHWITRCATHEPQSGYAYRKTLSKYSGFYDELSRLVPHLKWRGCRIPVSPKAAYDTKSLEWNGGNDRINGWGNCVLERIGVPMYFSSEDGGVLCLEGDTDKIMDDKCILQALKGCVVLASDSAENLIHRGFGKYLGVSVKEHNGKQPTVERMNETGANIKCQQKLKMLAPQSIETIALSDVYHTVDHEHYEYLFPGVTMYKNELGGIVFTFCGTPNTKYNIVEAFSFLCYSRKEQIVNILRIAGELPVYYPYDEEVYLKVADTDDDRLFCAMINLGLDTIEKTELVIGKEASDIIRLNADGVYEKVSFDKKGDKYILDVNCNILEPLVLLIS